MFQKVEYIDQQTIIRAKNMNDIQDAVLKAVSTDAQNLTEDQKAQARENIGIVGTGKDGVDGKDGYTPVKGKDYFDGKDGVDGKDGYTPQKGVDYFDGAKGEKGDTGAQGIQGEKGEKGDTGAPGVDGKDGADGKTPVKGTDYYTEADKAEMVNAVLSALPEWNGGSY